MNGWVLKTTTPPDLQELFAVAENDQKKALEIIAAHVDSNVTVEICGPISARSLQVLGIQAGKMLNVTS